VQWGFALSEAIGRVGAAGPAGSVCKRTLDVLGAVLVLAFFMPIGLLMIAAIRCSRPGPIFTREQAVGLHGRRFGRWRLHRPLERESIFDRALWQAGLADLPSAVNVIDGDMSLIGPRPHSPEQYAVLSQGRPGYVRRLEARPGMIWPRANEGEPSWSAELDYVARWSVFVDLKVAGLYAIQGLFREEQGVD
jgi:lipopolysaccharide/colanic/teichoic acid biosynthesis glycosyltransferase